jgi:hypothetical protein
VSIEHTLERIATALEAIEAPMSGSKRRRPSSTSPHARTSKERAPEAVVNVEVFRFDVVGADVKADRG